MLHLHARALCCAVLRRAGGEDDGDGFVVDDGYLSEDEGVRLAGEEADEGMADSGEAGACTPPRTTPHHTTPLTSSVLLTWRNGVPLCRAGCHWSARGHGIAWHGMSSACTPMPL